MKLRTSSILAFVILTIAYASPLSAQFLKASGKKIVDENGTEIILRGMGLGGWMLQEPYMMEMSDFAIAQWDIKQKISELVGEQNMTAFYDAWHANHCTRKDIDSLAAWGFNSVRLPMHYNLYTLPIEEEPLIGENTWLDKGFAMTDSLIAWCKANQMYVILDLHAAPGGQGKDKAISDYNPAKPSLWENDLNKQKTVALWKKLAQRYANEPWVGGYDLINEPNWSFTSGGNENGCSENSNTPLKQLLVQITNAIRTVDTKHIIIIEGNCWGNNYNGMLPTWDNNMVLSFHKYWSYNDQGSIQGIINLRNQYNVPIWLGESGENSNVWFTDAISLVEKNKIGWAWWPMKKIGSVVGPTTITKTTDYQTLLNYWKNGGTQPSVTFAHNALMQMAENAKLSHCSFQKDVIDAMFRQVNDSTTKPFKNHHAPGVITAVDFDLGRHKKAYLDTDVATYQVSTGTYTAWNTGWIYRNDAVDIGTSSDTDTSANGYYVGWTKETEWMNYTLNVDTTCAYNIKLRYAANNSSGKYRLFIDDADVTSTVSLSSTGGYQAWSYSVLNNLVLYKGNHTLKLMIEKGDPNIGFIRFSTDKKSEDILTKPVSAETDTKFGHIYLTCNKMLVDSSFSPEGFSCLVNGIGSTIASTEVNPSNHYQLIIVLQDTIYDIDQLKLSYAGSDVKAVDGTFLQAFSAILVRNNLPILALIPGKLEAENFSVNQGLVLETTTDIGGGQNIGFTNSGDYLEYKIRILKSGMYFTEVRVASAGTAGRIEIQQVDEFNTVVNNAFLNIPVTGGWQTWTTIGTPLKLNEGVSKLRVKIIQPEFNINWYKFFESGTGLAEDTGKYLRIHPNPAKENIYITLPDNCPPQGRIFIYNSMGSCVQEMDVQGSEQPIVIGLNELPRGLYFLEYKAQDENYQGKFIIQ